VRVHRFEWGQMFDTEWKRRLRARLADRYQFEKARRVRTRQAKEEQSQRASIRQSELSQMGAQELDDWMVDQCPAMLAHPKRRFRKARSGKRLRSQNTGGHRKFARRVVAAVAFRQFIARTCMRIAASEPHMWGRHGQWLRRAVGFSFHLKPGVSERLSVEAVLQRLTGRFLDSLSASIGTGDCAPRLIVAAPHFQQQGYHVHGLIFAPILGLTPERLVDAVGNALSELSFACETWVGICKRPGDALARSLYPVMRDHEWRGTSLPVVLDGVYFPNLDFSTLASCPTH
jgi:hypothetical protein